MRSCKILQGIARNCKINMTQVNLARSLKIVQDLSRSLKIRCLLLSDQKNLCARSCKISLEISRTINSLKNTNHKLKLWLLERSREISRALLTCLKESRRFPGGTTLHMVPHASPHEPILGAPESILGTTGVGSRRDGCLHASQIVHSDTLVPPCPSLCTTSVQRIISWSGMLSGRSVRSAGTPHSSPFKSTRPFACYRLQSRCAVNKIMLFPVSHSPSIIPASCSVPPGRVCNSPAEYHHDDPPAR